MPEINKLLSETNNKSQNELKEKIAKKCCVCDGELKNINQVMCDDCRRAVLVVRTVIALMRKDGLCFLSGFGDVEKEVKTINV